jgi:hypothetical protein
LELPPVKNIIFFLSSLWYDNHSYDYSISSFTISQPLKENFSQKGGRVLKIAGIICEYNPLHLGHRKQLQLLRAQLGADSGIVCLMSGNYVQRGAPAVLDKSCRAEAAVHSGQIWCWNCL